MKNKIKEREDCCGTCRWWQDGRCRFYPETCEATQWCGQHSATRPKPVDAEQLLNDLKPDEIRVRLDAIDGEAHALRVLLRASRHVAKKRRVEDPLGCKYEIRVLNDAVDGKAAALRVRLQAEIDRRTNATFEDLPLAEICEDPTESLPLSADGVRIAPGMMVHHPTEGTFEARSWMRDIENHVWLIQYDPAHLESNPLRVSDCYKSGVAMVEAANGSS